MPQGTWVAYSRQHTKVLNIRDRGHIGSRCNCELSAADLYCCSFRSGRQVAIKYTPVVSCNRTVVEHMSATAPLRPHPDGQQPMAIADVVFGPRPDEIINIITIRGSQAVCLDGNVVFISSCSCAVYVAILMSSLARPITLVVFVPTSPECLLSSG